MEAAKRALELAMRRDHGRMMALVARTTAGDLLLAEDALQQASLAALQQWPDQGLPDQPTGWLVRCARNKAIDQIRRSATRARAATRLAAEEAQVAPETGWTDATIPDERLRLICTCCHPALALDAQVGLTLRAVCGLSTDEIARAFLIDPRALAQRLVRAQHKIRDAGIPYTIPGPEVLPRRLAAIRQVVYLVFSEGHAASGGERLVRADLCEEALRLGELLVHAAPEDAEVHGLMALMLLQDARRDSRVDGAGRPVLLADQDRSRWDRRKIALGMAALGASLRRGAPGPTTLQAAIASVHMRAARAQDTDWTQIVALYDLLLKAAPSPVVQLNRAVAVAEAQGPEAGLALMELLAEDPHLARGHLLPAARAALLSRQGRRAHAAAAYAEALDRVANRCQRRFLQDRLRALGG